MVDFRSMGTPRLACVVLAAGSSVRMNSRVTKVLHPLCGVPMIRHSVRSLSELEPERLVIVAGHQRDRIGAETARYEPMIAVQEEPLGTGHAAMQAAALLQDFDGDVLIAPADAPLIRPSTYQALVEQRREANCAAVLLSARLDDPTGYGRILRRADGLVDRIVEHRDASDAERQISEVNTSVYCFDCQTLLAALPRLRRDNVQSEYYLTDVIGLLVADGACVLCTVAEDAAETRGVNDRLQLAAAEAHMRDGIRRRLMQDGVTMVDPAATFIDAEVCIGADTTLWPGAIIAHGTEVGARCTIGSACAVRNSRIGDDCRIQHCSWIADSVVGDGACVGPFASISGGANVLPGATVGSFEHIEGDSARGSQ